MANPNYNKKQPTQIPFDLEMGKIPPQSIELEEAVLGAIMLEHEAILSVIDILASEYFYKEEHQKIYAAIFDLYNSEKKIDILTVTEQLRKRKELDLVGGPVYVVGLTSKVASASHLDYHAKIVAQKFIQRELIRVGTEIQNKSFDESVDVTELLDYSNDLLDKVNEIKIGKKESRQLNIVLDDSIKEAKERERLFREGKPIGIPTPLKKLNSMLNGWPKDLILLPARSSDGKTAFALLIAKIAALSGYSTDFYSLETDDVRLADRLILSEANIPENHFRSGNLNELEWVDINRAKEKLNNLPIYIDDNPTVSITYLKNKIRIRKKNGLCDLAIIDYIQLTDTSDSPRNTTREREVSNISRSLKNIARSNKMPIIALSQLNRDIEKRKGDRKPQNSDLRESGSLEHDAHIILFLYRPLRMGLKELDNGESTIENGVEKSWIIVTKNKDGPIGEVKFTNNPSLNKIWDPEEEIQDDQKAIDFDPVKNKQFKDNDEPPF